MPETLYADSQVSGSASTPSNAHGAADTTFTTDTGNTSWTNRWGLDNAVGSVASSSTVAVTIRARKDASGGSNPTIDSVQLFDLSSSLGTDSTGWSITSSTGEDAVASIAITGLTNNGDDLRVELVTSAAGGGPNVRCVQVDAIAVQVTLAGEGPWSLPSNSSPPGGTGLGRMGPIFWDDNAYVFALDSTADDDLQVYRGTDQGRGTWSTLTAWTVGGTGSWPNALAIDDIDVWQDGGTVHCIVGVRGGANECYVQYRSYDLASETWNGDTQELEDGANTIDDNISTNVGVVVRSNGDVFVVYLRGGDAPTNSYSNCWWNWKDVSGSGWQTAAQLDTETNSSRLTITNDEIVMFYLWSFDEYHAIVMAAGGETWGSRIALDTGTSVLRNRLSLNVGPMSWNDGADEHHSIVYQDGTTATQQNTDRIKNAADDDTLGASDIFGAENNADSSPSAVVASDGSRRRLFAAVRTTGNAIAWTATDADGSAESWDTVDTFAGVTDASAWAVNINVHKYQNEIYLAALYYNGTILKMDAVSLGRATWPPFPRRPLTVVRM